MTGRHRNFWRTTGLSVAAVATVATLSTAVYDTGAQSLGGAGGPGATTLTQYPQPVTAPASVAAQSSQAAAAYWTPEKMAQAVPKLPTVSTPAKGSTSHAAKPAPSGGNRGGGENTAHLPVITGGGGTATIAPMVSAGSPQPEMTGTYPSPFSRWEWFGNYLRFPISAAGVKVFFTQSPCNFSGCNFVCSGSVVRPGVVDTAGHCANSGGQGDAQFGVPPQVFSSNVAICPSWDVTGCNFVGAWGIQSEVVDGGWFQFGDFDDDYGSFVANTSGGNCNCQIQQATGFLGFCWGSACPRDQHWMAFGYPQASPFTGNKLQANAGEWFRDVCGGGTEGCGYPPSVSQGNDLTGGSSGGPWIVNFGCEFNPHGDANCNQGNFVNGHNDWKFNSQPLAMQSPYYDQFWANVTNTACHIYNGNSTNCV